MGFRIATNVQSIAAQRALIGNRNAQDRSMAKLSSGERIVRAGDDAAGLAISEKLKAEIRSIRQANRNANDGISMIQTAEGGLNEIQNILIRLRELSMQASSDTVGDVERGFTDKEVQNLVSEIQRISLSTQFNGINLLNGGGDNEDVIYEFQVGTHNNPELDRLQYDVSNSDSTVQRLGLLGLTVATKEEAQMNLEKVDEAIRIVSENRSVFGALQNRLQSTINNLMVADENLSAANSRIRDVDIAFESSELTKKNILANSSTSMLTQANQNNMLALKLLA